MIPNRFMRRPVPKDSEGCKIKIKRDRAGKVVSVETNGKCNRELDIFKESKGSEELGE